MSAPIIQKLSFNEAFKKGYLTFFCAHNSDFPDNFYNNITASESYHLSQKECIIPVHLINKHLKANFYLTATLSEQLEKKDALRHLGNGTMYTNDDMNDDVPYINTFKDPKFVLKQDSYICTEGYGFTKIYDFVDIDTEIKNGFREMYEFIMEIPFYQPKTTVLGKIKDFVLRKNQPVYSDPMHEMILKHAQNNYNPDEEDAYYNQQYTVSETSHNVRVPDEFLTYEIFEGPLHCILIPDDFNKSILSSDKSREDNIFPYEEVEISLHGFLDGDIRCPKYKLMPSNAKGLRDWFVIPYYKNYLIEGDDRVIFATNSTLFFKTKEDALSYRADISNKIISSLNGYTDSPFSD